MADVVGVAAARKRGLAPAPRRAAFAALPGTGALVWFNQSAALVRISLHIGNREGEGEI